ncbi:lipopolysaccharide kinase InaA family protein [Singulisphaera sp. PoT]|uniref:lipopolysaccharide kinase InaA family protein n=1 Tax=Singulisphaera sp. PoT TaxID=3411797 RepID=UPI003BF4F83F
MTHGSFWARLLKGTSWIWMADRHREALPEGLREQVMSIESRDRYHAKQGRSTARVVFHSGEGDLTVYLKRHFELPWKARLAAIVHPKGRHTPASAEWAHLERVRALGIDVPEVVAAGEQIGPLGTLNSFLMVAELTGCLPLNEAMPELVAMLDARDLETTKHALIESMATIVAKLHRSCLFHKDLYLCHFYIDMRFEGTPGNHLSLIDLHRLGEHRWTAERWRTKDLAQLLFSTFEISGITDRDRMRFWVAYRKRLKISRQKWHEQMIVMKASRYLAHNRQ